jgi:hypothetical protein
MGCLSCGICGAVQSRQGFYISCLEENSLAQRIYYYEQLKAIGKAEDDDYGQYISVISKGHIRAV